jgi:adenine-specific DNA methylase
MWKEAAVTYFKVLSQNVLAVTEKKCPNFKLDLPYRPRNFNQAYSLLNKRDKYSDPKSFSMLRFSTLEFIKYTLKWARGSAVG